MGPRNLIHQSPDLGWGAGLGSDAVPLAGASRPGLGSPSASQRSVPRPRWEMGQGQGAGVPETSAQEQVEESLPGMGWGSDEGVGRRADLKHTRAVLGAGS